MRLVVAGPGQRLTFVATRASGRRRGRRDGPAALGGLVILVGSCLPWSQRRNRPCFGDRGLVQDDDGFRRRTEGESFRRTSDHLHRSGTELDGNGHVDTERVVLVGMSPCDDHVPIALHDEDLDVGDRTTECSLSRGWRAGVVAVLAPG